MFGIGIIFVMLAVVLMLILLSSFMLPKLFSVSVVSNRGLNSARQNHTEQIENAKIVVTDVVTKSSIEAIDVRPTPLVQNSDEAEKKVSESNNPTSIPNLNKDKNIEGEIVNSPETTEDKMPSEEASKDENRSFNFDNMADDLSDIF